MANINLGKVGILPKGAHVPANTYKYLELVTDDGSSYVALQDVPGGTAISNTTYWLKIASKGDTTYPDAASDVTITDAGGYFTGTEVESALQEVGADIGDLTYTEQNYVTDAESLTDSIDALDVELKDVNDDIGDVTTLNTTSKEVVGAINELYPFAQDPRVFGIKYDKSTLAYTRTDSAFGLNMSPSLDSTAGYSDFDDMPIFGEIEDVTDTLGNEFVKIPKHYVELNKN